MTVDDLIEKDFIRQVTVQDIPEVARELGNRKSISTFGNRMCGFTCAGNSQSVVSAMRENGNEDWILVLGYAFSPERQGPIAHVWVKHGSLHYDPTWPIWKWWTKDLRYYEIVQPMNVGVTEREILGALEDLAQRWGLKLDDGTTLDDDL